MGNKIIFKEKKKISIREGINKHDNFFLVISVNIILIIL